MHAMSERAPMEFAVQARLIERRGNVVVRDETRWDTATALDEAVRTARAHAADGFTVWIYEVRHGSGTQPTYVSVDTMSPAVRAQGVTGDGLRCVAQPDGRR